MPIEIDRETDGRWIAEETELPGCLAYGQTEGEAREACLALAARVREGWRRSAPEWTEVRWPDAPGRLP